MELKELIINKPSDLINILNRKEYTRLILNCEVSPKLLFGFDNIEELTISSEQISTNNKIEENINIKPFIHNIEKLSFVNINNFGRKKNKIKKSSDQIEYVINYTYLKSINFIFTKRPMYGYVDILGRYLMKCNNLEEISFKFNDELSLNYRLGCPSSLKKIKLEFIDKKYEVDLKYNPEMITSLGFDKDKKTLFISYENNLIASSKSIDVITDKVITVNKLKRLDESLIVDNCLIIPEYITELDFDNIKNYLNPIKHISFNVNLLNSIENKTKITDNNYLELLKTITIRNNSEMSLFKEKVINVNEIEVLKDLYICDYKLFIVYDKEMLIVDSDGVITKKELGNQELITKEELFQEKIITEEPKENENVFDLDKYSISELEEYLQYRKLLESFKDSGDSELLEAVNLVGRKLVKKLDKGETYE